jgi:NTP pyrophosphatase (non-canonical NTP hydrolase)
MPPVDLDAGENSVEAGEFARLRDSIRELVNERGWKRRDTPKNLVMALSIEVSELMEPFQWLKTGYLNEIDKEIGNVRQEMADVLIYLIALADELHVDLYECTCEKIQFIQKKHTS